MKTTSHRKTPHFFVINPTIDRRNETRFETKEPVEVKCLDSRENSAGVALEIQKSGLRFESKIHYDAGSRIQLTFPKTPDNTGCFGRVAWVRPSEEGKGFLIGVAVESWFGVVRGPDSWKRIKGIRPKVDRRNKPR